MPGIVLAVLGVETRLREYSTNIGNYPPPALPPRPKDSTENTYQGPTPFEAFGAFGYALRVEKVSLVVLGVGHMIITWDCGISVVMGHTYIPYSSPPERDIDNNKKMNE
jgi:hypothetical protein